MGNQLGLPQASVDSPNAGLRRAKTAVVGLLKVGDVYGTMSH
jgi:hypothetical protein